MSLKVTELTLPTISVLIGRHCSHLCLSPHSLFASACNRIIGNLQIGFWPQSYAGHTHYANLPPLLFRVGGHQFCNSIDQRAKMLHHRLTKQCYSCHSYYNHYSMCSLRQCKIHTCQEWDKNDKKWLAAFQANVCFFIAATEQVHTWH